MLQEGHFQELSWCKPSARVAKVLMERALTNSISPSIFTSLFMLHSGQSEGTGEKALKVKRGLNLAGFSGWGLQNGWKRSSPGLPHALTLVSNPGGIAGCAAGGFGLPLHSQPLQRQIVTRAELCPQQGRTRPPLSCHCFPFESLQVAPGHNPAFEAHLERAVAWSLQLHGGTGLGVPVTGLGCREGSGHCSHRRTYREPKPRRRGEGTGRAARYRAE